jgi:hypothetical protein
MYFIHFKNQCPNKYAILLFCFKYIYQRINWEDSKLHIYIILFSYFIKI